MAAADYYTQVYTMFVGYFGRPPAQSGLDYYANIVNAAGGKLNAVLDDFHKAAESQALFAGKTIEQQVNIIFQNLFGRDAAPTGLNYWAGEIAAGRLALSQAAYAIAQGAQTADKGVLTAKIDSAKLWVAGLDTTNEILVYGNESGRAAGRDFLKAVSTSTPAAQAAVDAALKAMVDGGNTNPGQTYTLTTGVDTVAGTAGNDTINGNVTASGATLSALDNIDGGAGTDTLVVADPTNAAFTFPTSATIKNVEVLNVVHAADGTADTITADLSGVTGLTTVTLANSGTDVGMTVTTKGNVTTLTLNEGDSDLDVGTGVTVTDSATTDTLTSVTLNRFTDSDATTADAVSIASDKLTSLKLANTAVGATVTAAAGTRVLGLTLDGVTGGTVTDATATTLNIASNGTKTTAGTVVAAAATTVSIAADEALSLTALTVGAATGLTVTGDSLVTLAAATLTALTSIDASAQTAGGVDTKAFALGTGVTFKGGAGADSIQLGATTKAITMGAGEDRVALTAAVTALGTGGSIDAGDGTADTLAFLDADDAGTATATATFAGTVSNFEVVELAGAAGAGVALNLANLDNIASVKLSANVGQALTISNMATGGKLAATVSQTGATTVGVANAAVGTTDVVNLSIAGTAAVNTGSVTVADVETVNYLTDDTATTPTGIAHTSTLVAAAAKTITVTGDAGLTLTNTNTTITSFDASGVTKGAVTWTTGALAAAAAIKGGAEANTIVATAATKAVTYTGGAKVDTVTINNAQANVINTAAGDDVIVVGTGANTIDAGDGNDSITIGASVGLNTVNVGAGTDTVAFSAASSAAGAYASVTGMSAGDKISFSAFANDGGALAAAALGSKITLGGAAGFANYLDAAAAGNGGTDAAIKWFQLGGNTYVVLDNSAAATFQDGVDHVVELIGTVDLSTSTQDGSYVVTLV